MLVIQCSTAYLPEKQYVFHVLFQELLGLEYRVECTPDRKDYLLILPNGRQLIVEDHFFGKQDKCFTPEQIPDHAETIETPFENSPVCLIFGRNYFSQTPEGWVCGVDLIAATFFMLSRWEEQVLPDRDQHGRFPAACSLAVRSGFLERPIVHEYEALLRQMLLHSGYPFLPVQRRYRFSLSCDVDHPRLWWSPADRWRTFAGALFKRRSWQEALSCIAGSDPFDIWDEWLELFQRSGQQVQFNFMGQRAATSDCYYPLSHPFVLELGKRLQTAGHSLGFHASYESFHRNDLFQHELRSLKSAFQTEIRAGRNHYLRFEAPETWQQWQAAGLETDSTLGYAEAAGFRCGICVDFPVFDFLQRKMLPLRELPLIAMEITLANYQGLDPNQALAKLEALRKTVKQHEGVFTLLWHNSSWNTPFWRAWQFVLKTILKAESTETS